MALAHDSNFTNRSATGNESQVTVQKNASVGIKESMESGNPVKVVESNSNTIDEQEPIVKDLKWKAKKHWTNVNLNQFEKKSNGKW